MSDSYQAIYDATRSKIGSADAGQAIERAAREAFDISTFTVRIVESQYIVRDEMTRHSVLFRPAVFQDGNKWCALYGDNIQEGVAGFGNTPDDACRAFDQAWANQRAGSVESHPAKAVS